MYCDVVNGEVVAGPSSNLPTPLKGVKVPFITKDYDYDDLLYRRGNYIETIETENGKPVLVCHTFPHIPLGLDEVKINLKRKAAERRYQEEIAGTPLVDTSRESQVLINTAYTAVQIDPTAIIDFEGKNGWEELNAEEVTALAAHVGKHVQDCRTNEKKNLVDAIDAAETVEEALAVDMDTGWPTYG